MILEKIVEEREIVKNMQDSQNIELLEPHIFMRT